MNSLKDTLSPGHLQIFGGKAAILKKGSIFLSNFLKN